MLLNRKSPVFPNKPVIRQEDGGVRLLFECHMEADPLPTLAWFHDDKPLTATGKHRMICEKDDQHGQHKYYVALQVDDVTVDDAGKYRVVARNKEGEGTATISLNFDSKKNALTWYNYTNTVPVYIFRKSELKTTK